MAGDRPKRGGADDDNGKKRDDKDAGKAKDRNVEDAEKKLKRAKDAAGREGRAGSKRREWLDRQVSDAEKRLREANEKADKNEKEEQRRAARRGRDTSGSSDASTADGNSSNDRPISRKEWMRRRREAAKKLSPEEIEAQGREALRKADELARLEKLSRGRDGRAWDRTTGDTERYVPPREIADYTGEKGGRTGQRSRDIHGRPGRLDQYKLPVVRYDENGKPYYDDPN